MLFCYLLFNAGVSYSMHFCGELLTSSEIFKEKKDCACKSTEQTHDCCKDVHVESAGDEQQTGSLFKINLERILLADFKFLLVEFESLIAESSSISLSDYHSPPFYKVPRFIFNQIFRL